MEARILTMVILLPCAHIALRTVWTVDDLFFQQTLSAFSYPPIFESPKQNLRPAVTADFVPRGV